MLDMPLRFAVGYGLLALMAVAAVAFLWWSLHNTRSRRDARARHKQLEEFRRRDEEAAKAAARER